MPFVNLPGLTIYYGESGLGVENILFVHGNFASGRWWKNIMGNLPAGCHAYAPDMRGCGKTQHVPEGHTIEQLADDLYEFVKKLKLENLHLVGHSLGGAVSLQFTLNHSELVTDLILVDSAPAAGMPAIRKTAENFSWLLEIINLFNPKNMISRLPSDTLGAAYETIQNFPATRHLMRKAIAMMTPSWTHQDNPYFDELVDDALIMSPQAMAGHLLSLEKWNVQDELRKIKIPVLLLLGGKDILITPEQMQQTLEGLNNGKLVIWDDVGHSPQIEQAERFINLMISFIEGNKTQRKPATRIISLWQKLRKIFKKGIMSKISNT